MTDRNIIEEFDTRYNEAYTAWNPFYAEAEIDMRFYLGDQWDATERTKLYQEGRNAFVFNRIRRNINMLTGYQRKHRLSSVVIPQENSDQKTADQLSQLLLYAMNYANGYQVISDCFGGALKTGWNLCDISMDYRDDPVNGDIKLMRSPFSAFITDPYVSDLSFETCGYILRRKYLSPEQVVSLLPKHKKEIWDSYRIGWERDDKFTWLPYQRQPNGQELMAYNEFVQQKWRDTPMLVDMETGEFMDFDVPKDRQKLMLEMHSNLKIVMRPKRYIQRHIIVNDILMQSDEDPYGLNEYNSVPFVAIWEPESNIWDLKVQSLVRCQRDAQRESNMRMSQMSDILNSQINSGWIANENSVINPRSLFQTSQGKVIWKREDAPADALQRIEPAQIPPSQFQMQDLNNKDMMEIMGINDAAFGITDNPQESGVLMMLRQGAALTNCQDLMDNLRFSQKMVSQKMIKLIQTWTPSKVKRILNEEPTEEFYSKDFTKYDITITEGMLTDTQKQIYFRQLVDLKQLGAPVTGEMLARAAPIQGKSTFNDELAEVEKQQAAQAQAQNQMQQDLLDSQRQLAQSQAIYNISGSKERFTRSVANLGLEDERASKAVLDRSNAALERIKAIKELQSMDDDRLLKYVGVIQAMEEQSRMQEEQIKKDNVSITARAEEISNPQQQQQPPMQQVPQTTPTQGQPGVSI